MFKMRFCAVDTGLFFIITSFFLLLLFFFFFFAGETDLPSYGTVFSVWHAAFFLLSNRHMETGTLASNADANTTERIASYSISRC